MSPGSGKHTAFVHCSHELAYCGNGQKVKALRAGGVEWRQSQLRPILACTK